MLCKWCDEGDEPTVLDVDGVQSSISGQPGLWGHAYEDDWWPCQRKAAEEHAEIERLRTFYEAVRDERLRLEQLEKEYQPGLVERRLADAILDALQAAES